MAQVEQLGRPTLGPSGPFLSPEERGTVSRGGPHAPVLGFPEQ